MIVCVSIVDKHLVAAGRPGHVGTYMFEIERPNDSHFDFMTVVCPPEQEAAMRQYCGRLLQISDIPNPIRGDGSAA